MANVQAPFDRVILGDGKTDRLRRLDFEYQVETLAATNVQLVEFERKALALQAGQAFTNLVQLQEQQRATAQLENISAMLPQLAQSMDRISESNLRIESELEDLRGSLEDCFQRLAEIAIEQRELLRQISEALSRPYETQVRELRNEATRWLEQGMAHEGRDRREDWSDAMRLYLEVIKNPIGMQDYVTWFRIGWLQWKSASDYKEAEDSFYRSQRLSSSTGNSYHLKALRYLAYMRYKRGDFSGAERSQEQACSLSNDAQSMYDLARYKSKLGKSSEAADLLCKCLRQRVDLSVSMFAEEDFIED